MEISLTNSVDSYSNIANKFQYAEWVQAAGFQNLAFSALNNYVANITIFLGGGGGGTEGSYSMSKC